MLDAAQSHLRAFGFNHIALVASILEKRNLRPSFSFRRSEGAPSSIDDCVYYQTQSLVACHLLMNAVSLTLLGKWRGAIYDLVAESNVSPSPDGYGFQTHLGH